MWCNFHVMLWYTYLVPLLGRLKGESQIKSFLRLAIKPGYCFVTNGREHALRQNKWHSFWRTADARKVCFQNSFTVANLNCQLSSQKKTNKKLFPNYFQLLFSSYFQILLAEPHFDILFLAFAAGGLWEWPTTNFVGFLW